MYFVVQFACVYDDSSQFLPFIETVAYALNESRKAEPLQSLKNEGMHILSKSLNNASSKVRHSARIRVPNSRFGYLLPGFSEQSGSKKRNNMKTSGASKQYNVFQDFYVKLLCSLNYTST